MTSVSFQPFESRGSPIDRQALEAVLERTRHSYHELVGSLSEEQLALESAVSGWTVREVLRHLSRVMEIAFVMMVRRAKKNKAMPKLFHTRLAHWLNYQAAKVAAKGASREKLLEKYDAAHDRMVGLLRGVEDSQWMNRTAFPNGVALTMERIFSEVVPGHFAAHAAEIEETVAESEGKEFEAPTYRDLMAPYS